MLDAKIFRDAMSEIASPVFLLTTDGPAGRAGMTVTAVASVSDQPPTLLVCVNRGSPSARIFAENQRFALNALSPAQQPLADLFAGRGAPGADKFSQGLWRPAPSGAPTLADAKAWFDCRLAEIKPVASHELLIGEVLAVGGAPGGDSLLYGRRAYRRSGDPL